MSGRFIFLTLFLFSFFSRLYYVSDYRFAFTIDQARDMLEIRKIAVGFDPVFIGPTTSLNGIFLGPFWFYLNLPAFIVGGGDPTFLAFFQVAIIHLGILLFWLYFRKRNPPLAFWGSLLLLVSPRLFEAGSYSFNANTTPVFVLLSLLFLDYALEKKTPRSFLFLGFLTGLTLQLEAAFGILLLPLSLLWLLGKRISLKPFLAGFLLTLLPQLLFELKHRFAMTKVFLTEFSGGSDILGDKIGLSTKIADRVSHYLGVLASSLPFSSAGPYLFLLAIIYLLYKNRSRFFFINLSLVLISLLVYLIYPFRLKDWWMINLAIPYILITALAISRLPKFFFLIIVLFGALPFFQEKWQTRLTTRSTDRALLKNQIETVDWIYREAADGGFSVYTFIPAVYDYNYQYLFWWYGNKKYGYLPEKLTYQDDVPSYVENNQKYWINTKPQNSGLTFLILETDPAQIEAEKAWRQNLPKLCKMEETRLTGDIIVEKTTPCEK